VTTVQAAPVLHTPDPRDPEDRLQRFFDDGSMQWLAPRDTSGVLALKSLEGAEFDSAYVTAQLEAHRANIDAIRAQLLPAAQDADARQFLQKTLAAMEKHQAALQGVQSQLQR